MKREIVTLAALTLPAMAEAETVSVNGYEISYEVHGDMTSDQVPILLLHGGMMNTGSTFSALIPALSADRPVIGVDQQGHGRTAQNNDQITLENMRSDTIAVLDALGVESAHVIGFSMGGMLGLDLAVNAPDRVASLSSISASQNKEGMLPELAQMQDPNFKPDPVTAERLPTPEDFALMAKDFETLNPGGAAAMQETMQETSAMITSDWGWNSEEFGSIPVPVQLIFGDKDFVTLEHAVHMSEQIPEAWLAVLPDTTHMNIMAHPALSTLLLRRIERAEAE